MCLCDGVHVRACVRVCACVRACVCVRVSACVHACVHVCVRGCMYMPACVHALADLKGVAFYFFANGNGCRCQFRLGSYF